MRRGKSGGASAADWSCGVGFRIRFGVVVSYAGQREKLVSQRITACFGSTTTSTNYPALLQAAVRRTDLRQALVHIDLDVLDASIGHANWFAAPGGLTIDQLDRCLHIAGAAFEPLALTLAALDPSCHDADQLLEPAIASACRVAAQAVR